MHRAVRMLVAGLGLSFLPLGYAGTASGDPANKNTLEITLDCCSEGTVDAVFELSSSDSFHVVSMSSNSCGSHPRS